MLAGVGEGQLAGGVATSAIKEQKVIFSGVETPGVRKSSIKNTIDKKVFLLQCQEEKRSIRTERSLVPSKNKETRIGTTRFPSFPVSSISHNKCIRTRQHIGYCAAKHWFGGKPSSGRARPDEEILKRKRKIYKIVII